MAVCQACQVEKDVMAFYSLTDGDDRYHSICRACRANGVKENAEILAEYKDAGIKATGGWMPPEGFTFKKKRTGGNYVSKYKKTNTRSSNSYVRKAG